MSSWSLAAAAIGPKAQGRNYGVRRYAGPILSSEAQARIDDFAMSLTGWAILRLDRFAAMFPLTADHSAFALVRARHLGEGELGPIAVAHLLVVPRAALEALDWRSGRLLSLIPEPDNAAFGLEPVELRAESFDGRAARVQVTPKLAWTDLVVDADGSDPLAALEAMVEGVDPAEQRARLTGWATTSVLARAGGLDPAALFRLVTHAPAESVAAFEASHEAVALSEALPKGRARPQAADAPVAWAAWRRLAAIAQREADAAPLAAAAWSQDKAALPADVLMFEEIARVCASLPAAAMVALLRAVARGAEGDDAASAALRHGISETFDAIVAVADEEGAAFYVERYLAGAGLAEVRSLAGLQALLDRPEVAAWLGESCIDAALRLVLEDLTGLHLRRLAASLVRLHCARTPKAELLRPALDALLAQPASAADLALADPSVVQATAILAPHLSATLTARAVQPAMRAAQSREDLYRAAWALVTAERVGAAA